MTLRRAEPSRPVAVDDDVVRRHAAMVWRHLRLLGAAPALAEDLRQETFLRLLRTPPDDRGDAALGAWLRTTARNLYFAARRARGGLERDDIAIEAVAATDDLEARSYLAALRDCLLALDPRERRAIEMRYAPGGDRRQVAEALGIEDEGAKSLLRRLRARLVDCVARRMESR